MKDPFSPDLVEQPRNVKPMLEAEVQEKSVERARRRGWWARKFSSPSNRSVHDYVFGKNDFIFWVEFKREGVTEPTDKQADEHDAMRKCSIHRQAVIDTVEKFEAFLERMESEENHQRYALLLAEGG